VTEHLLTFLVLFPLFGALVVLFMPRQAAGAIRNVAMGLLGVELLVSLALLRGDFTTAEFQFLQQVPWVESLGISYKVGVDGISLWLVLLTTALTPIALFVSWTGINTKIKEYALSFLLLEAGMLGAFVALDLFLFYVFWELMLVPMYLIIGVWGGPQRVYAAVKFFLYTMAGSLLMLIAILYLVSSYHQLTGSYSFDLTELGRVVLPYGTQFWLFAAFALAFAIKVPMFPFHTWLPDAHVQAPTGGSVILAAVLLKLGTYGFLRFAMPLFPLASHFIGPTLAALALVGIVYGAWCAWVQRDVKKLVAYSSVSHMGFIVLGMFAVTDHGVSGAILQMINHGISTGALFILVGVIYERRHTRDLDAFGGLAKVMPIYALVFVIVTMSSIGLPGTNGFVGEFMILSGTFVSQALEPWPRIFTLVAASGVIFAAVYMLHAVLKMFWGPIDKPANERLSDMTPRELAPLVPLLVLIFWIGLFPKTFLDPMAPSVNQFIADYRGKMQRAAEVDEPTLLAPGRFQYRDTAAQLGGRAGSPRIKPLDAKMGPERLGALQVLRQKVAAGGGGGACGGGQ
jgi:NADH-quinone oxidoreductase subunit M